MAVHRSLVIFALVAAIIPAIFSYATEFVVGGNDGWKLGVDYQKWARQSR